MYYRVALQIDNKPTWKWKSTVLSSLNTLFQFFRLYNSLPHDQLLVFSSSTRAELDEMLVQENKGYMTGAVTVEQFLYERKVIVQEQKLERSAGEAREQKTNSRITTVLAPLATESNDEEPLHHQRSLSSLEKRRYELEMGAGSDHDQPYTFTLPTSLPQWQAWMRLQSQVYSGALEA